MSLNHEMTVLKSQNCHRILYKGQCFKEMPTYSCYYSGLKWEMNKTWRFRENVWMIRHESLPFALLYSEFF